jgi:hypothetical protein
VGPAASRLALTPNHPRGPERGQPDRLRVERGRRPRHHRQKRASVEHQGTAGNRSCRRCKGAAPAALLPSHDPAPSLDPPSRCRSRLNVVSALSVSRSALNTTPSKLARASLAAALASAIRSRATFWFACQWNIGLWGMLWTGATDPRSSSQAMSRSAARIISSTARGAKKRGHIKNLHRESRLHRNVQCVRTA